MSLNPLRRQWRNRIAIQAGLIAAVCAAVAGAMVWSEFSLSALTSSGPRFAEFFGRLSPPDWSVTGLVINSTVETLMIVLAGTFVAVLFALPMGFLAASNVTPGWVSHSMKFALGLIRSIPLIVVALIFVTAVGLGPFAGALAIAFHSIGMLGKFYAEEFETADQGIIDSVSGSGAKWLQTLRFGLFPQCLPQVVSFTVFRFEMNFRDAAVLGLVGAGGIGLYIQLYVRGFQYEKVAVLLLVILTVVALLDQLTYRVRKWIR